MRFGLFTSLTNNAWPDALGLWRHVEATGWDAACVTDHFMPNTPDKVGDTLECWTALAALAALVPRLRIGTIVVGNTYRHPALVAKMAATVDVISGGRLVLGLGAAWQQNEHEAYGIPFYTMGERLARLDEACQVIKLLWTQERTTFAGRFYQLKDAPLMPKPLQRPHPELMIGGGGEKVTLRIVARHADHWNVWGGADTLAGKGKILDEHCAAAGRDPQRIRRSANMALLITDDRAEVEKLATTVRRRMGYSEPFVRDLLLAGSVGEVRDKLDRLREAGVDMLFFPTFCLPRDPRALLDRFMSEVAPAFR
ncbi:MAG TPA: TIGR03560 family F420-dependent LLM class oxidoreductase [Methylomirabilota bacterium]|jgi:F420-dependent oxidoreductase-like protein|nr:TIGR03560 family F420-dependent LLM class oxidoreductase [Methylomirabilota bacterium]